MERLEAVLAQTGPISAASLRQIVPGAAESGEWFVAFNTLSVPRSELCRVRLPGVVGRASRLPTGRLALELPAAGEPPGVAGETPAPLPDRSWKGTRLEDAAGRAVAFRVTDSPGLARRTQ